MILLLAIAADHNVISVEGIDVIHGLIVLLGMYYCTDQDYPWCYSQFLGILQTIGLKEEIKGFKGVKTNGYVQWM